MIGPPLPPTGPLNISNVSKDRATLSWRPPENDGGSKVTGYVVERRDLAKGPDAWVPVAQNCKDTTFTVPSLLDGHQYEFRVMATNENGISEPLRSSAPVTAQLPFSMLKERESFVERLFLLLRVIEPPGAPGEPEVGEVTNNTATLTWDKPASDGGRKARWKLCLLQRLLRWSYYWLLDRKTRDK